MRSRPPFVLPRLWAAARLLTAALAVPAAAAETWEPLFDGRSLAGWKGEDSLWSVRDGAIAGSTKPAGSRENTFLVSEKTYENFILRLRFRLDGPGNSGIQFRSELAGEPGKYVVRGYQADIGPGYYGSLYDELRRGMLAAADRAWVEKFLARKRDGWHDYEVRALGNRITLSIDGLVTARYTEEDPGNPRRGVIALQLHSGPGMEILFKDLEIQEIEPRSVLYVTTSAGFRHDSIPASREVLEQLGRDAGWFQVRATESTEDITPRGLEEIDCVIFYTTGDLDRFPLARENREALIGWVREGGAFVGCHSATDTYKDWEPYWDMLGGTFAGHPWGAGDPPVKIDVEDPAHPSAQHLGDTWLIQDEIYQFRNYSRGRVHVILSLNEESIGERGDRKDRDYGVAWCREYGAGRVFYTSLGHRQDVWTNPDYQQHLLGGILWALEIPGHDGDATPGLRKPPLSWEPLFDGETLSGWTPVGDGRWEIGEGGGLEGSGGRGHLFSPREYTNFHFKADFRIFEDSNSGMYFRAQLEPGRAWPRGMEAQVNSDHADPIRTGSLYGYQKVFEQLVPAGRWGTQEIIAMGSHVVVKVNGRVTVSMKVPFDHEKHFPRGRFAFQQHHQGSRVDYRDVMVRELAGPES